MTDPRPVRYLFGFNATGGTPGSVIAPLAGLRFENIEYRYAQTWGFKNHLLATPEAAMQYWYFDGVSIDGRPLNSGLLADPTVFVTQNVANFVYREVPLSTPTTYTLTTSATSGTAALEPPGGIYNAGTLVTLTATADSGHNFSTWSGDATGISISTAVTMDSDKSVRTVFTPALTLSTIDTCGGTTVLNCDTPQNTYIGNDELRVSTDGTPDGQILLGDGSGTLPTVFAMTGGLITIDSGVSLVNGGWGNGNWTNNKADMQVNGILDLWDGQAVRVNALNGAGSVEFGYPWNGGPRQLHVGVDGGSGTFSGLIAGTHPYGGTFIHLLKDGTGTQTFDSLADQKPEEIIINDGVVDLSTATDVTFATTISGAGSLSKTGAGVLTLTGSLTQTGSITLSEDSLSIGTNLSSTVNILIATGAVLDLNFAESLTVNSLEVGSTGPLPPGIYGPSHSICGSYFTGTGSLRIAGGAYETWAGTNGVAAGSPEDDPDGDGIKNLLE